MDNRKALVDAALGMLSSFERRALQDKYESLGEQSLLERDYVEVMERAADRFKEGEDGAAFALRDLANEHKQELENKRADYEEEFGDPE